MNKNIKSIFLVLAFITLLATLGVVCAVDDANNTIATDASVSDATVTNTNSNPVVQEPIQTASNDNKVDTRTIEKENKNLKTSTKTVEVNNYDELSATINNAVNDLDNDEYIINLNEGTYQITTNQIYNSGYKKPNIIINGNNQILSASSNLRYIRFNNGCNITINNATITHTIQNYANNITFNNILKTNRGFTNQPNMNITLINSTINSSITNNGLLIIDNNTIFTDSCTIDGGGQIIIDNITKLLPYMTTFNGNYIIENMTLTGAKTNNGNLTIRNSNISILNNNGNLTMENSTCESLQGNQYGNATVINCNITNQIYLSGNVTVNNSDINTFNGNSYSNITIINSTLKNSNTLFGGSTLNISDDCIFNDDFVVNVNENARIIYHDYAKIAPYLSAYYFDNYVLENITISSSKANAANLTIRNATINTTINNYGNLTICDDVIFGENTLISGNGQIIINDTSKISPYLSTYNGTYTLKDTTITKAKTNYGNLTIQNSTINTTITNNGNLTIADDVIFGENTLISGNGQIIINDTSKISPYLSTYNGTYTLKDTSIAKAKTNYGNLTIQNSTITGSLTNNGELTIQSSLLNNSITNNATLIISDDCILGDNFNIRAESNSTIISNLTNITSYITYYRGNNFTIENQTITKTISNNYNTNLTIINSTVNTQIQNIGRVIFKNSTVNASFMQLTYEATLILSDDTILGESFSINQNGQLIANATNERAPYLSRFDNGTVSNLTLDKGIYGTNLTMINSTNSRVTNLNNSTVINSTFTQQLQLTNATLINSTIIGNFISNGEVFVGDSILDCKLTNNGVLIISDDTIIGENFNIIVLGEIIINDTNKINPYIAEYHNNTTIENKILTGNKTNNGNLTIINSTVNDQITNRGNLTLQNTTIKGNIINNGYLTIDEDTIIEDDVTITGNGVIITDNITRLLPYLSTINGNYTIKDTTLDKIYNFIGDIKLDNCTITAGFDNNYGLLNITNSIINISDKYDYWIENNGVIILDENTEIINGKINDLGTVYNKNVPEDYVYDSKIHIVNNKTFNVYFGVAENVLINPGDTLDFQGTINKPNEGWSITIENVNVITSTNDGRIETISSVAYRNANVTGLTLFNTQCYIGSNSICDNITNIVNDSRIGTGQGQTSISGENVTLKNSYIYTRNNGGSSSVVLRANYCNIINNTVVGGGGNGNLIYLTTYGTVVTPGQKVNHHNKILNNTIIGPSEESGVCIGFCLAGSDNIFDGNIINYTGEGVAIQWGSGQDGVYEEDNLILSTNNTVSNNKLYSGCGISGGDYIYNNYVENGRIYARNNSIINNNTCNDIQIIDNQNVTITNNNILNQIQTNRALNTNSIIENNTINNINISSNSSNLTFINNNITGLVIIDGSNINFTNNNITNNYNYTITGKGTNNTISENYLVSKEQYGDNSVNLNKEENTIKNNKPKENELIVETIESTVGQNITIKATIYNDGQIVTNINKGKVTFKVNGKTLKDASGKVIYAKVVNGVATIENYEIPPDWTKEGTTIEAIYSGSTQCKKLTSEKTEITITAPEATLTITPIPDDVQTGSTITLKAKVATGDKAITTGKIVFKVNGKTVKDANGKVIYAKVDPNGEASVDYTIPESFKAGTYNIEAVFTASGYDKLTSNTTMTVVKS